MSQHVSVIRNHTKDTTSSLCSERMALKRSSMRDIDAWRRSLPSLHMAGTWLSACLGERPWRCLTQLMGTKLEASPSDSCFQR